LLRKLRENRSYDEATLDKMHAMYRSAKPLWIKVGTLRNEVFGHRAVEQTMERLSRRPT